MDLADSLSSSRRRGDDVLSGTTTSTPVLLAGTIDGLLCGRVRVYRGHETLLDTVDVVDHLGEGRKAVCSA